MVLDHRNTFRTSVLLACVIICSNVLCPVGAYLYNNRYAGDYCYSFSLESPADRREKALCKACAGTKTGTVFENLYNIKEWFSDQVFRITPSNDEGVQALKKILGRMKETND